MRTMRMLPGIVITALLLSGCGYRLAITKYQPTPIPSITPPTLIAMRGESHPLAEALTKISFKPFVPAKTAWITDTAVLPSVKGDDERDPQTGKPKNNPNWGIGFEYQTGKHIYALSEWPQNGAPVASATGDRITEAGCTITRFRDDAVLWTTAKGIVMTLQPDGKATGKEIVAEGRRLARLGACK